LKGREEIIAVLLALYIGIRNRDIVNMFGIVSLVMVGLGLVGMGLGTPVHTDWKLSSRCRATSSYEGWSSIKYAFIL
jgi:carbon starvation protein CstA